MGKEYWGKGMRHMWDCVDWVHGLDPDLNPIERRDYEGMTIDRFSELR